MKKLLFPKPAKGDRRPVFSKVGPSEAFVEFFCTGGGSIVADCELCGRTHYDYTEAHNMEPGEFKGLEKKRKAKPGQYITIDHTAWFCQVGDLQAVVGCPCNGLTIIENFLWGDRYRIAKYMDARAQSELIDAQRTADVAKKARKAATSGE